MKYILRLASLLVLCSCSAQMSIRHIYFEDDFSPYDTYMLKSFMLNGKEVNHHDSKRTNILIEKLDEAIGKMDFTISEDADFYFTYKMYVDTLPIGYQRPEGPHPQDIIADITIEIFDAEYKERLFAGNIYGLLVEDKKSAKNIRRIYRKLFRGIER